MLLINYLSIFDHFLSKAAIEFGSTNWITRGLVDVGCNLVEIKGLIPAICFWFLWFKPNVNLGTRRIKLVALLVVSVLAIATGRALAILLPFRFRPLATSEIMGDSVQANEFLESWSSMPSDHALLFFALTVGFYQIYRPVGLLLLVHALFIVSLARILGGQHFPSDILIGGLVGASLAFCLMTPISGLISGAISLKSAILARITRPEIVYPVLFVVTFQFATMFDGLREIASLAAEAISKLI